jgi:aspartate dehydrogenase
MTDSVLQVTLIGWGAIARSIFERVSYDPTVRISHVVVRASKVAETQAQIGQAAVVCAAVPADAQLVLECAGHSALKEHVLPVLQRGVPCGVLSVGALSEVGLPESLEAAAKQGQTQVHLLSGAIGGIDAISAARVAGLTQVTYTGRKPPLGWKGSPAEQLVNLDTLQEPTVILASSAREAAHLYPKNANVAATVSLAGLGLDATRVRLIADPGVTENIHEIHVQGTFGEMHITLRGKPLPDNPKTSALTVLSAVRFLQNQTAPVVM